MDTEVIVSYGLNILGAIALLFIGNKVATIAAKVVEKAMVRGNIDATLSRFTSRATRWSILAIVLISCLGFFGIETTSFIAILGSAGLAVGLALQGTLSNVGAGAVLLVLRPFRVGDYIEAAGSQGFVFEIGLFATSLDTLDNKRVIVPNSSLLGTTITNYTHHETRRADVKVGVDYDANPLKVREVLDAAAMSVEGVIEVQIFFAALGGSSLDFEVRATCACADYWSVYENVTQAIKLALDDAGISIPYPQMDVHMDTASA